MAAGQMATRHRALLPTEDVAPRPSQPRTLTWWRQEFLLEQQETERLGNKVINTIRKEPKFLSGWGDEPKGKRQKKS